MLNYNIPLNFIFALSCIVILPVAFVCGAVKGGVDVAREAASDVRLWIDTEQPTSSR